MLMFQYLAESHEDDFEILSQRAVIDEMEVILYLLGHDFIDIHLLWVLGLSEEHILIGESDGGIICYAGLHGKHDFLLRRVEPHIALYLGPWPHKTHVADENVPQLRQLIDFVFPDDIAHLGDTTVALSHGDEVSLVGTYPHGAEFIQSEGYAVFSDAFLGIEPRPSALYSDENVDEQQQGREQNQPY